MAEMKVMEVPTAIPPDTKGVLQSPSSDDQNVQVLLVTKYESEGEDSGHSEVIMDLSTASTECEEMEVERPERLNQSNDDKTDTDQTNLTSKVESPARSTTPAATSDKDSATNNAFVESNGNHENFNCGPQKEITLAQDATKASTSSSSSSALNDVGNKVKTEPSVIATPKKSNLKRREPATEAGKGDEGPPPKKRVRIVENVDETDNPNNNAQMDEKHFPGMDDVAAQSEEMSCDETITWLSSTSSNVDQSVINLEYVREHMSPVKRNFSVEIDFQFILSQTVTSFLACKSNVSTLGPAKFHFWIEQNAVHNHPWVKLRFAESANFVKLANLDALLKYDLTSPPKELFSEVNSEGIYYVGDLYQESRGFKEYLLWRISQGQQCFSTKVLSARSRGPRSTPAGSIGKVGLLHPFIDEPAPAENEDIVEEYGTSAKTSQPQAHNILDIGFINGFVEFVHSRTGAKGLHLFIADNAEVSYSYESCREVRFQKHLYTQCLLALRCLREGGTFICKIFDTITLFTNGLLFLMYKCFQSVTIHKPSASPSYTAERFLICRGKIENRDSKYVVDFLSDCLDMVVNNQEQRKIFRRKVRKRLAVFKMEVQTLVPLKIILSHVEFFQFIRMKNIKLSGQMVTSIQDLWTAMNNPDKSILSGLSESLRSLHPARLTMWNLAPTQAPEIQSLPQPDIIKDPVEQCQAFLRDRGIFEVVSALRAVRLESVDALLEKSSNDLASVELFPVQGYHDNGGKSVLWNTHGLFFGCRQSQTVHIDLKSGACKLVTFPEVSLPWGTLVIGEMSEQLQGRKFVRCLHLFDAIYLRGLYIGGYSVEQRRSFLTRFASCIRNESLNVNLKLFVHAGIDMDKLSERACKKSLRGYPDPNMRCYRNEVMGETESQTSTWTLMRGILMTGQVQVESPKTFFENYKPCVWYWNSFEELLTLAASPASKEKIGN